MSAFIGSAAGGFVSFLLGLGFTNIQQRLDPDGNFNFFGTNQNGKPFNVTLKQDALRSPQYDLVEIIVGAGVTKKPDIPQFSIKNEGSGIKKIFTIGIIPDAAAKSDAVLEVFLNESRVFPISDPTAGMFQNVTSVNIPIPPNFGLKIEESKKLEVFAWTPTGVASVFTFAVFIANQV